LPPEFAYVLRTRERFMKLAVRPTTPNMPSISSLSLAQDEGQVDMRYNDIQALLICWENANTVFHTQREQLDNVLKKQYIKTKPFNIPFGKPNKDLGDEIQKFKDNYDKEQNLLIVYYGGHGIEHKRKLIFMWLAKQQFVFFERWPPLTISVKLCRQ
jgi:hypothetical protein